MGWLGTPTIRLETCESTNDEAERLAEVGAAHGTVVIADLQTNGRGRQGRVWQAPATNGLFWSCVLRPSIAPAEVAGLTLAAGIAACHAVRAMGVGATLKWPNDLVITGPHGLGKLGGILVESATRGNALDHVVVGIGINLGSAPSDIAHATCLAAHGGSDNRDELIGVLTAALESWFEVFFKRGVAGLAEAWLALAERRYALLVTHQGSRHHGVLAGLSPEGLLLVELPALGTTLAVRSGEVEVGEAIA